MLIDKKIAVIGLGYVGLPLAVEFGKHYEVVGFDIDEQRVAELRDGIDTTLEVDTKELRLSKGLGFSCNQEDLQDCNIYIVTVPTPIDEYKRPDISALLSASNLVGEVLSCGDIVIYESTVYPGATEEDCVPVLSRASGLEYNKDYFCGYSPERINPGDKKHRLTSIVKVVSGSTEEISGIIDQLYSSIISAGTYRAESIAIAEAAKVIENTQRDVNIALINEFSIIFSKLNLCTDSVLRAAQTKWNFLPFKPGLVGGHCIGVDPYYLTHKAESIGYSPQMILSGRRLNDGMALYVAGNIIKGMSKKGVSIANANLLVMGYSFKENCPDIRNTKVKDMVSELQEYGLNVDVYDPWVESASVRDQAVSFVAEPKQSHYDGIVVAVAHDVFLDQGIGLIREYGRGDAFICDLKSVFESDYVDMRL